MRPVVTRAWICFLRITNAYASVQQTMEPVPLSAVCSVQHMKVAHGGAKELWSYRSSELEAILL